MMEDNKIKNYTFELQSLYLNFMLSDPSAFTRCQNIIESAYWHDRLKPAVRYILGFADEYQALPTFQQVVAETGVAVEQVQEIKEQHTDWFLQEIEAFCRHRATELVLFDSADLISEGRYSEVETRLKDALTISLQTDLGVGYWDDPKSRIQAVLDRQDVVSTGWETIDRKLYGGFTKGTLNIFAGGSGSGKSLFLQNLALNWAYMGHDVIYISLELSENLVAARLDQMVTGYGMKDIFRKIDDVDLRVRIAGKKAGDIKIKKMPEAGTSANDIRAYLKEYEIQTGKRPTALLVDYLDLMYPNNKKVNPSDMFVKDKFVSEELRALSSEYHLLFATASQLNRSAVEANGEFDHSHIAGGISKINTADNVFGIFTSAAMRERGEYRLQMLKTRSSNAVGQFIELAYNIDSLRIVDPDIDADITEVRDSTSIGKDLKAKSAESATKPQQPKTLPATETKEPQTNPIRTNMMDILNRVRNNK